VKFATNSTRATYVQASRNAIVEFDVLHQFAPVLHTSPALFTFTDAIETPMLSLSLI
jgi:hypothetical protein